MATGPLAKPNAHKWKSVQVLLKELLHIWLLNLLEAEKCNGVCSLVYSIKKNAYVPMVTDLFQTIYHKKVAILLKWNRKTKRVFEFVFLFDPQTYFQTQTTKWITGLLIWNLYTQKLNFPWTQRPKLRHLPLPCSSIHLQQMQDLLKESSNSICTPTARAGFSSKPLHKPLVQ